MEKTAILRPYLGLGDSMYLRISVKKMLERYERVFICTPMPKIFSDIPGVMLLDPTKPGNRKYMDYDPILFDPYILPHYMEFIYDKHMPAFSDYLLRDQLISSDHVFRCMGSGEGYQDGNFYMEMMVERICDELKASDTVPSMNIPTPLPHHFKMAEQWFIKNSIDPKKAILFHSLWRGFDSDIPTRSINDEQWAYIRNDLENHGYALFDAERSFTGLYSVFQDIPFIQTTGWEGLMVCFAAIHMCAGVVMQNSCRLLPMAQDIQKPTIVCSQGASPLKCLNWGKAFHKLFIELEPEHPHGCMQNWCSDCKNNNVSKEQISKAVTSFHHDIQTTTRSS